MSQDNDDEAAIRRDAQSIYDTLGAEGKAALKRVFELREDIIGRLYRRAGIGPPGRDVPNSPETKIFATRGH